jgi:hypothetical protein
MVPSFSLLHTVKVFATQRIKIFFFLKGVLKKMSGADPTVLNNAKHNNLAKLLTSAESVWETKGFDRKNIFATDNGFSSTPTGQKANFGGTDHFRFRKRGGRVFNVWMKITISAGTLAAGNGAAYSDDLGQLILEDVDMKYASKDIQNYNGEALKAYKRLMEHDITKEHYNATNEAGLPPGAGGGEARRQANVTRITIVYPHLEWLYFTRSEDYALTPEALSSEVDLSIRYRRLENLVYTRVTANGNLVVGEPFTVRPAITESLLFTQLIHTPGPEKEVHLRRFDTPQGLVYKILDFEQQVRQSIAAAAGVYTIKLDNFRLDSQFIMFFVRRQSIDTAFAIDRMQTATTQTILNGVSNPATNDTSALLPIISFRLIANGKAIVDPCTDIENRAVWRKMYWPGSQVAEAIYFIPWSHALRDHRNVVNFQNMANLGNVELELTMPLAGEARLVDVYNICHNVVQKKQGDIIRILR